MWGVFDLMGDVSEDSVRGERAAVEEWLLGAYPAIRRFASVVGPSEVGPDDLVHDAIVKMMQAGEFGRLRDPMAYLKRAVVNLASNERRRLGASRRRDLRVRHEAQTSYSDVYPSSIDPMLSLSPNARAVVYLHYVEGESFEDIATTLKLRASSVRQTATRARRQLAQLEGIDQ